MHCIVSMYLSVFLSVIKMAGLNYYKPKFNWDALDKLSELDRFKAECEVLFNGPLDESPLNIQAGLVVNWLGSEAGLLVTKDRRPQSRSQSGIRDCKYCGSNHQCKQCPAYRKACKSCGKNNHFAKKCRSKGQSQSHTGMGSKKSFKYREVNVDQESSDDGQIDEITSKVRSMYYNDIHFNSVNTRMHIKLNSKSCNGNSLKTHFKVDTGANGNLLPLGEFFKHFPNANMTQLAKTIDSSTKLYAYNNTEIKQLGACELLVEYRECHKICQFYVVDFPTAILGIHDSESLGLITVHFDCIGAETFQIDMHVNAI